MKYVKGMVWPAVLAVAISLGTMQGQSSESGQKTAEPVVPATQSEADKYKLTVNSNLVFLPTRVGNKNGETVYGLKPEQFIVEDNGVPQDIKMEESPEASGLSLVVAVQCGMSAPSEFSKLKGLAAMIDAIVGDAPHEVSIISYGEGPYVLSDFSDSPDDVRLGLSKIKPCGSLHAVTIDTVYYAINKLKRRRNHYRRAILLISETRDHGSKSRLQDVVAELGSSDTVIYCVAFSPARDQIIDVLKPSDKTDKGPYKFTPPSVGARPAASDSGSTATTDEEPVYAIRPPNFALPKVLVQMINALRKNTASELASLSGGEYINFTTQKGFDQGLQRISNQIHNYYLLSFKTASTPTWDFHSLKVRVPDDPDAVIQTRKSYWSGALESRPAQPPLALSQPEQVPQPK